MTAHLESKVLIVTDETVRACADREYTRAYKAWQLADERLVELPSPLCETLKYTFYDWLYTIDLDWELLSVNMWIHFNLQHIPRDSWIEAFHQSPKGKVFYFDICPEATDLQPTSKYFASDHSQDEYKLKYRKYDCSVVTPNRSIEASSKIAISQIMATILFDEFITSFDLWFRLYIPGWSQDDFGFREFAFAILSFAAGEYHFSKLALLEGQNVNGLR
jgi:hypothetical protein